MIIINDVGNNFHLRFANCIKYPKRILKYSSYYEKQRKTLKPNLQFLKNRKLTNALPHRENQNISQDTMKSHLPLVTYQCPHEPRCLDGWCPLSLQGKCPLNRDDLLVHRRCIILLHLLLSVYTNSFFLTTCPR